MDDDKIKAGCLLALVLAFLIFVPIKCIAWHSQNYYVTAKVEKAERVSSGSGDSITHRYLVFTDQGTYECTDDWVMGKFSSSDIYGRIKAGESYRFHLVGWRLPIASTYPNILQAEKQ